MFVAYKPAIKSHTSQRKHLQKRFIQFSNLYLQSKSDHRW